MDQRWRRAENREPIGTAAFRNLSCAGVFRPVVSSMNSPMKEAAFWACVIGGNVGCIRHQIADGEDGFPENDVVQTAERASSKCD
jgi:hypothetical protein